MKRKRWLKIFAAVSIAVVLITALTGCMKIGMREDNIRQRLTDAGYTNKIISVTPWLEGFVGNNVNLTTVVLSQKTDENGNVFAVFVQVCRDYKSADWVEAQCKGYEPVIYEDPADAPVDYVDTTGFQVYRYEFTVLFGDFTSMSVARGY